MIDTINLLPPDLGPRSNPVLFGIAEAIAELFPPVLPPLRPDGDGLREPRLAEPTGPAPDAVASE